MKLGTVAFITKKVLIEKLQAYYKSIIADNLDELIETRFTSLIPTEVLGGLKSLTTKGLIEVCTESGYADVLWEETSNEFPTGSITNICVIDQEDHELYLIFDEYFEDDELIAKLI